MVSISALQGFILEELIAKLLQSSGFDLLVEPAQDKHALTTAGNGLVIRGRGAKHQVDVLGQVRIDIPFSYPIRLFVEAKFRSAPIGLEAVRNAVGVVNDVNEHYSSEHPAARDKTYTRYQYKYALFSASGFTSTAQTYAITQQISLVDMSVDSYSSILNHARRLARELGSLASIFKLRSFPLTETRTALRAALGTWPGDESPEVESFGEAEAKVPRPAAAGLNPKDEFVRKLPALFAKAAELDEKLYFGFSQSPFILVLKPDDPSEAEELLRTAPSELPAELGFAGPSAHSGEWALTTRTPQHHVTFRVGLPRAMERLLLGAADGGGNNRRRAGQKVIVAWGDKSLEVDLPVSDRPRAKSTQELRKQNLKPELTYRADEATAGSDNGWNERAARELVRRLEAEGKYQAKVIRVAAMQGGVLTREQVLEVANFGPDRMLRGITRPPRRITAQLIEDGLLPPFATIPLWSVYEHGVSATHFEVPKEFSEFLS